MRHNDITDTIYVLLHSGSGYGHRYRRARVQYSVDHRSWGPRWKRIRFSIRRFR